MKKLMKHKNKIIAWGAILAVLGFLLWWGGNSPSLRGLTEEEAQTAGIITPESTDSNLSETLKEQPEESENSDLNDDEIHDLQPSDVSGENYVPDVQENAKGKNEEDGALACTLSVRCDTILQNMQWLEEEKINIVPQDGVIFAEKEVVFYEGESVFNVTLREMKKNKIHFEFVNTPIYNSAYIEGIANLYEFDCGELSGWVYRVNGEFPNFGCSRYTLSPGDRIEWIYTCDLGKDVGGGGIQRDE